MPMSVWLIDGREYKERVDVLVQELRRSLKTSDSYPIARLFELLPLNPATADIQGAIVARGAFVCKPGSIANSGDSVDAQFDDARIGRVGLYLPASISAAAQVTNENVTFSSNGNDILVTLPNVPPNFGLGNSFVFERLVFGADRIDFVLLGEGTKDQELTLRCSLVQLPSVAHHALRQPLLPESISIMAAAALSSDSCTGSSDSDQWVVNRDGQGVCYVQRTTDFALGVRQAGPYSTQAQAAAEKQRRVDSGDCA